MHWGTKNLCDSLYCNICFVVMVWNWTRNIANNCEKLIIVVTSIFKKGTFGLKNVCFAASYEFTSECSSSRQTTLTDNQGSFNSILRSLVDSAVSALSNDFENEHQSIFIHYGFKIDCLVNQLQCIATASTTLCQSRKSRVSSKTWSRFLAMKKIWEHYQIFKLS